MDEKKVLVLGATGFVGKNLCNRLHEIGKYNAVCLGSKDINLLDAEKVQNYFKNSKIDVVIFLAAKYGGVYACKKNGPEYLTLNSLMAINSIIAALENGIEKFIYVSSAVIYPKNLNKPIKEEDLLTGPLDKNIEGYGLAKILGTKLCQLIGEKYGKSYFSVVPTNMYGPYDRFYDENSNVVAALITKFHDAKKNNEDFVELYGTGKPKRDLLFIEDFVDALLFLLENYEGNEWINVGTGKDVSIKELADIVKDIVGYKGKIFFNSNYPDGTMRKLLDISKIKEMGWTPKYKLSDGLKLTYEWFLKNVEGKLIMKRGGRKH